LSLFSCTCFPCGLHPISTKLMLSFVPFLLYSGMENVVPGITSFSSSFPMVVVVCVSLLIFVCPKAL
jgi:hypothetical protein